MVLYHGDRNNRENEKLEKDYILGTIKLAISFANLARELAKDDYSVDYSNIEACRSVMETAKECGLDVDFPDFIRVAAQSPAISQETIHPDLTGLVRDLAREWIENHSLLF